LYRDLKLENVLIANDGYIKLVDFGLAKINETEKANAVEPGTFCGTPEYLSPEMLRRDSHDNTLDWWALGILLYELIIGVTPFFSTNQPKMFFLIANGPVRWPNPERH
jgi:serine/threonine protein kinase